MSTKIGNRKMRRVEYQKVKKMDRQQFELFCQALYEEGQQSIQKASTYIDLEDVRAAILSVKGIGEKRAEQIMEQLQMKMEGAK